jgi:SAM-dependent methyltransferase
MMRNRQHDQDSLGSPDRFGYEWTRFDDLVPEYEEQFNRWISVLESDNLEGLYVVDAGCGTGRNSFWMNQRNARRILAFDVESSTVDVARRNLREYENIQVKRMSIYEASMPNGELADIAFSIGVVHHLSDPKRAISRLSQLVKQNGYVVIWVYGAEGNRWLLRFLNPLRKLTKHIPMPVLNGLSNFLAIPLYFYLRLPVPKSQYLNLISNFRYWHLKSIVLDQLLPKIANYWSQAEVKDLMETSGLRNVVVKPVNGMSWSASGQV